MVGCGNPLSERRIMGLGMGSSASGTRKLLLFAAYFWVCFSTLFLALFRFLTGTTTRVLSRTETSGAAVSVAKSSDFVEPKELPEMGVDPEIEAESDVSEYRDGDSGDDKSPKVVPFLNIDFVEPEELLETVPKPVIETGSDVSECRGVVTEEEDDSGDEKKSPKFVFKFEYQSYRKEEEEQEQIEFEPSSPLDSIPTASTTSKYEFLSGKDFSHYVEEPEAVRLTVKECFLGSDEGFAAAGEVSKVVEPEFLVDKKVEEIPVDVLPSNDDAATEAESFDQEASISKGNKTVDFELPPEDLFMGDEMDLESIASSSGFMSRSLCSTSDDDGFFSDCDSEKEGMMNFLNSLNYEEGVDDLEDEESQPAVGSGVNDPKSGKDDHFKSDSKDDPSGWDSEDTSNGLEILWEHQELIEQLKMELKNVKATGLPTILEDDECPKIVMEDLKPWKIEEKFHHEDRMSELHKFYKSYRERMRKFDILNYQKMYATSFLQSEDPFQSTSASKKIEASALGTLFTQKLMLLKRKKSISDPMANFMKELQGVLETVYVGQMCLSWEILHWQYQKALELYDSDHFGTRIYNEVAGEFQQFQVLLQRFIENEPFEGPRLQNYVKKRVVMRNLLQVPVIREDGSKDKKARRRIRGKDGGAITSDQLVEIMEESIRIMWRFIRADKDSHTAKHFNTGKKGTQIEPREDPAHLELLSEVHTNLQKKEKRLKEMMRSGSCILRKFQKKQQKHDDEDSSSPSSDNVLYFFCQVDMKLVARVLNMSKITTEQLLWCRSKLSRISFVGRRVHVDPSFSLFPC
ncbi:unnamed protein product [Linum tenue]|uniref:Ribosomal protein L34Ae n=1 Tax=Linum tenue TaxID=586396 RepID=A0AAV0HVA4_9ROSI|nr:unnamed protein product [Linum tenue]